VYAFTVRNSDNFDWCAGLRRNWARDAGFGIAARAESKADSTGGNDALAVAMAVRSAIGLREASGRLIGGFKRRRQLEQAI
jgi:hypothetical protein